MKDLVIVCCDCGEEFTFDIGEQEYYKKNNLYFPKRCKDCRKNKRRDQVEEFDGETTSRGDSVSLDNVEKYISKQDANKSDSIDYSIYGYYR